MKLTIKELTLVGFILGLSGCANIPKGAQAITNFDKDKYLGKWFEIARLDFAFERNLNNTSAEYFILKNPNFIGVRNRGYNYKTKEWKEAIGKANFRGSETIGALKVSFFGPFYGAYNIIALDEDYQYALVAGKNTRYLWILSRTKNIPEEIRKQYLGLAESLGYKTNNLIWVEHNN